MVRTIPLGPVLFTVAVALLAFGSPGSSSDRGVEPNGACSGSAPCLTVSNTGVAYEGTSAAGAGLFGVTKNASSSSSSGTGVEGDDLGSESFNKGVVGTSTNGTGVSGTSGSGVGVAGIGSVGGLIGESNSGAVGQVANQHTGLYGNGATGVQASSTARLSPALVVNGQSGANLIRANNSSAHDVFVVNDNGDVTVSGGSASAFYDVGQLFDTESISGGTVGTEGAAGVEAGGGGITALITGAGGDSVFANGYGGLLFEGLNSADNDVFQVDDSGTVSALSFNSVYATVRRPTASGGAVLTNVEHAAQPTIADTGEAQLRNGEAWIALDPRFAASIDASAGYLVFLTPEGATRGLYTAQKTSHGFGVRECRGGTSSLPFAYRIVAKPLGSPSERLAPLAPIGSTR